jgi:hypothetical protein
VDERKGKRCPSCGQSLTAPPRPKAEPRPEPPLREPPPAPLPLEREKPVWKKEDSPVTYSDDRPRPFLGPLFTILFGLGTILIIVFVFLPILDAAYLQRQNNLLKAAKVPVDQLHLEKQFLEQEAMTAEEPKATPPGDKDGPKKPGAGKSERLSKLEKELKTAQKQLREDELDIRRSMEEVEVNIALASYWYRWGMFAGYVLLAIGSIGYLHPRQSTTRRVVGAIIICIQVVWVFLVFAGFNFPSLLVGPPIKM